MKYVLAVAAVLIAISVPVGIAFGLVVQSEHRWCATLDLLTARPVPSPAHPAANPSRLGQYQLYLDFARLRGQFGCR